MSAKGGSLTVNVYSESRTYTNKHGSTSTMRGASMSVRPASDLRPKRPNFALQLSASDCPPLSIERADVGRTILPAADGQSTLVRSERVPECSVTSLPLNGSEACSRDRDDSRMFESGSRVTSRSPTQIAGSVGLRFAQWALSDNSLSFALAPVVNKAQHKRQRGEQKQKKDHGVRNGLTARFRHHTSMRAGNNQVLLRGAEHVTSVAPNRSREERRREYPQQLIDYPKHSFPSDESNGLNSAERKDDRACDVDGTDHVYLLYGFGALLSYIVGGRHD